ncbi:MAG: hypothetical protein UY18_C0047G0007 [Microgenomates group bacterium GW2011_GWF2_47_9]|nr:MAG: hypothetical protein UY18_C0047G0007 [Microgenomates group bacterium GW2011_GWF2_47_9]
MGNQFLIESADGYKIPTNNAIYAEALRRRSFVQVDLGLRNLQLQAITEKLMGGNYTEDDLLVAMGYLADSHARITLGDKYRKPLFKSSTDTGEGRPIFHEQEAIHNKQRALLTSKLSQLLDGDSNKPTLDKLAKRIGSAGLFKDPKESLELIISLTIHQEKAIEGMLEVPDSFKAVMGLSEDLIVKEGDSMRARRKLFNTWRTTKSLQTAAYSAGFAAVVSGIIQGVKVSHVEGASSVEHTPTKLLDHDLPTHQSIETAEILDPQTGEVLDASYAHIPAGTHWVADLSQPNVHDLVLDSDPNHVLLNDATFTSDGHLNLNAEMHAQIANNNLKISYLDHDPVTLGSVPSQGPELVTSPNDTVDLRFGDLPGQDGGADGWLAHSLNESYSTNPPEKFADTFVQTKTEINAIRELWQGWENIEKDHGLIGKHYSIDPIDGVPRIVHVDVNTGNVITEAQPENLLMKGIPWQIGTQDGHRALADILREAIHDKNAGINLDPLHQKVWEIGYKGTPETIPDEKTVKMIFDAISERVGNTVEAPPPVEIGHEINVVDLVLSLKEDLPGGIETVMREGVDKTILGPGDGPIFIPGFGYERSLDAPELQVDQEKPSRQQDPGTSIVGPTTSTSLSHPPTQPEQNDSETESDLELDTQEKTFQLQQPVKDIELDYEINAITTGYKEEDLSVAEYKTMMSVARRLSDEHNLPVAYLIRNKEILVLTKPPELVSGKDNEFVYTYFDPASGEEKTLNVAVDGEKPLREDMVFLSSPSNWPTVKDHIWNIVKSRPYDASEYLNATHYDLSNHPELIAQYRVEQLPGESKQWVKNAVHGMAYAAAVYNSTSKTPIPVKLDEEELNESEVETDANVDKAINDSSIESGHGKSKDNTEYAWAGSASTAHPDTNLDLFTYNEITSKSGVMIHRWTILNGIPKEELTPTNTSAVVAKTHAMLRASEDAEATPIQVLQESAILGSSNKTPSTASGVVVQHTEGLANIEVASIGSGSVLKWNLGGFERAVLGDEQSGESDFQLVNTRNNETLESIEKEPTDNIALTATRFEPGEYLIIASDGVNPTRLLGDTTTSSTVSQIMLSLEEGAITLEEASQNIVLALRENEENANNEDIKIIIVKAPSEKLAT